MDDTDASYHFSSRSFVHYCEGRMERLTNFSTGECTEIVAHFKEHLDAIAFCTSQGWSNGIGVRAPTYDSINDRGRRSWIVVRDAKKSE